MTEISEVRVMLNELQYTAQLLAMLFVFAGGVFFGLLLSLGNPWRKP